MIEVRVRMQSDLIFDVGLHKGEDSEFYLKKGFRVVGIDASPDLCAIARQRLANYVESGRLTVVNAAIVEKSGPVKFFANDSNSVWGTASEKWARRNDRVGAGSKEITVEGINLREILSGFGVPYFMKIDIEGSDFLCLKALTEFTDRPKFLSIEWPDFWRELREQFKLLEALGYSRFKIVRQGHVPRQTCPYPALEGSYVEHRFEYGSSGLFGEEAPGSWRDEKDVLREYRRLVLRNALLGRDSLLNRFSLGRHLVNRIAPDVSWYDTHAAA